MKQLSETELEDLQKMLETFRPIAGRLLPDDKVNSLMAYMAEVIHSEFYAGEMKLAWPASISDEDRENIVTSVREMLNGLIARRFITELKRVTEVE